MRGTTSFLAVSFALAACSSGPHDAIPSAGASAQYPEPPDGGPVTWDGWVNGFSNAYCVSCHSPTAPCGGAGCHSPSDPSINALQFDMRQKSAWTDRIETIKCGIAAKQDPHASCTVPPYTYPKVTGSDPLPPDDERAIVVGWIDAGCP